jgi:hypothetical protein
VGSWGLGRREMETRRNLCERWGGGKALRGEVGRWESFEGVCGELGMRERKDQGCGKVGFGSEGRWGIGWGTREMLEGGEVAKKLFVIH